MADSQNINKETFNKALLIALIGNNFDTQGLKYTLDHKRVAKLINVQLDTNYTANAIECRLRGTKADAKALLVKKGTVNATPPPPAASKLDAKAGAKFEAGSSTAAKVTDGVISGRIIKATKQKAGKGKAAHTINAAKRTKIEAQSMSTADQLESDAVVENQDTEMIV